MEKVDMIKRKVRENIKEEKGERRGKEGKGGLVFICFGRLGLEESKAVSSKRSPTF